MHKLLKELALVSPFWRGAEYDFGYSLAVDSSVRREGMIPPSLAQSLPDLPIVKSFVACPVGVEHASPQFRQLPGYQALAASHAAQNADCKHKTRNNFET